MSTSPRETETGLTIACRCLNVILHLSPADGKPGCYEWPTSSPDDGEQGRIQVQHASLVSETVRGKERSSSISNATSDDHASRAASTAPTEPGTDVKCDGESSESSGEGTATLRCLLCGLPLLTYPVADSSTAVSPVSFDGLFRLASPLSILVQGDKIIAEMRQSNSFSKLFNAIVMNMAASSLATASVAVDVQDGVQPTAGTSNESADNATAASSGSRFRGMAGRRSSLSQKRTASPSRHAQVEVTLPYIPHTQPPSMISTQADNTASSASISPFHALARQRIKQEKADLDERSKKYMHEADILAWKAKPLPPKASSQPTQNLSSSGSRITGRDTGQTSGNASSPGRPPNKGATQASSPVVQRGGFDNASTTTIPAATAVSDGAPRATGSLLPSGSIVNGSMSPIYALSPQSPSRPNANSVSSPTLFSQIAGQNFPSLFGSLRSPSPLQLKSPHTPSPGPVPSARIAEPDPTSRPDSNTPLSEESPGAGGSKAANQPSASSVGRPAIDIANDVKAAQRPENKRSSSSWLRLNGMSPPASSSSRQDTVGTTTQTRHKSQESPGGKASSSSSKTGPTKQRHVSFQMPEPVVAKPQFADMAVAADFQASDDANDMPFEMDEDIAKTSDEEGPPDKVAADEGQVDGAAKYIEQSSDDVARQASPEAGGRFMPGRSAKTGQPYSSSFSTLQNPDLALRLDSQAQRMRDLLATDAPSHRMHRTKRDINLHSQNASSDEHISDDELDRIAPVSTLATSLPVQIGGFMRYKKEEVEFQRKTSVGGWDGHLVPALRPAGGRSQTRPYQHHASMHRLPALGEEASPATSPNRSGDHAIKISGAKQLQDATTEDLETTDVTMHSPPVPKLDSTLAVEDARIARRNQKQSEASAAADEARDRPGPLRKSGGEGPFVPPHLMNRKDIKSTDPTMYGTSVHDYD